MIHKVIIPPDSLVDTLRHSIRWPMNQTPDWITDTFDWIGVYGPIILVAIVAILLLKAILN